MSKELIIKALERVIDPELRLPLTQLDMVGDVEFSAGHAEVEIKLTITGCPAAKKIQADVEQALADIPQVSSQRVSLTVMTAAERADLKAKLRAGKPLRHNPFDKDTLTKIYLIGSGKGGVGKSTITANLAVALAGLGNRVGLIDADIYGFSIPDQLGISDLPTRVDELILPPLAFDVKVISIGMFIKGNTPVAWRGPMLHRAMDQFLSDVYWGDLDVLLVDLPPGTGDIAISLGQLLPTAKTIVITTPQSAASNVAQRSGAVGLQTGQSIFGVIENMSYLEIAGERHEIFGSGGGEQVARELTELSGSKVELLGQIPLEVAIREGSDSGIPQVIANPQSASAAQLVSIAGLLHRDSRKLAGKKLPVSTN